MTQTRTRIPLQLRMFELGRSKHAKHKRLLKALARYAQHCRRDGRPVEANMAVTMAMRYRQLRTPYCVVMYYPLEWRILSRALRHGVTKTPEPGGEEAKRYAIYSQMTRTYEVLEVFDTEVDWTHPSMLKPQARRDRARVQQHRTFGEEIDSGRASWRTET